MTPQWSEISQSENGLL